MATLQLPTLVRYSLVVGVAEVLLFAVRETTHTTPPKPRLLDRVREAIRARHSSRRTEDSHAIRTVQRLLGHHEVSTTMIYTHVLNRGPAAVRPADRMFG